MAHDPTMHETLEPDTNNEHVRRARPRQGCQELDCYLHGALRLGASDLHLKAGSPARLRVAGELRTVQEEPLPIDQLESMVFNLKAVVCQKLLPSIAPEVSRVPAVEVMLSTPSTRKLIGEERDNELIDVIRGGDEGMQTFTDSLMSLLEEELIDLDTARKAAPNPEELNMRVKGIVTQSSGILA